MRMLFQGVLSLSRFVVSAAKGKKVTVLLKSNVKVRAYQQSTPSNALFHHTRSNQQTTLQYVTFC